MVVLLYEGTYLPAERLVEASWPETLPEVRIGEFAAPNGASVLLQNWPDDATQNGAGIEGPRLVLRGC